MKKFFYYIQLPNFDIVADATTNFKVYFFSVPYPFFGKVESYICLVSRMKEMNDSFRIHSSKYYKGGLFIQI